MFSSSSSNWLALLLVGTCLYIHGVQAGVKSPYRKNDNLDSGESGQGKCDDCLQQKQDIEELRTNITQVTKSFQEFRHMMEHHIHHLHVVVDNQTKNNIHSDNRLGGTDSTDHSRHGNVGCGGGGQRPTRRRYPTSFMRPPRVRNSDEFDFAICNMKPNSKLPGSNVTGRIILTQKKNSPTMYISIRVSGFDVSQHADGAHDDHDQSGTLVDGKKESDRLQDVQQARQDFTQQLSKMSQSEKVIDNGHSHAFQVHENADLSDGCDSTGGHYNPYNSRHGAPSSNNRHMGDFGNIECDDEGATNLIITDDTASLRGQYSIVGKPIVIHQTPDDYSNRPVTAGRIGGRLACCIIEKIPSNLYNEYTFSQPAGNQDSSTADYRDSRGSQGGGSQGSHNHGAHGQGSHNHDAHGHGSQNPAGFRPRTPNQGATRPGSQDQGGHIPGSHDQGAHDLGETHDHDQESEIAQKPSDFRRGKNPYSASQG